MVPKAAKVLIATIGLCLGSAAIAENLVAFGTNASGTVWYYDAETVRKYADNTVEVWTKEDASKDKTVSWRTATNKFRIDCSAETFRNLGEVTYRANGTVMSSSFTPGKLVPVVPGTLVEILFKIMCSK